MVTSQKDQIQSLITDIERVLGTEKPRTPWVKASDTEPQRQALVRAQAYLMSLQQSFEAPGGWGPVDPTTGQIATQEADPIPVSAPPADNSAEDVLQALLTEMKYLKSSALQPLRLEMDSLREERDTLSEEVKALAEQRSQAQQSLNQAQLEQAQLAGSQGSALSVSPQQISEEQLNEFLQVLMSRLQESLSVQVTDTLGQLESEHSAAMAKLTAATEIEILELKPTGQIEEIRQIQSRSDQLLANIDSTLQGMFETLQTNIDSYQLSLNEGIENMHSLGRQGEVIVRSLVDHLTQQLGQTTPPEPAFYPPRSAAPMDDGMGEDGGATDTVSSLNEILPAAMGAEGLRSAAEFGIDGESEPAIDESAVNESTEPVLVEFGVPEADSPVSTEAVSSEEVGSSEEMGSFEETPPEAFIREDGTIDIDRLKLDIDRSEDDPALSRDDLMIDAAMADAQVAETEADNADTLDLETKVKPTADAAFLADLTFDDLVVDSSLAASLPVSEIAVPEVAVPEVAVPELVVESPVVENPTETDSRGLPSTPENPEGNPAPELAAVLPNLGSDADASDNGASAQAASQSEDRPESASVPDLPDASDESLIIDEGEVDAVLPDDLVTVLAEDSEAADKAALEVLDGDLDELAPDLEETAVFEGELPSLSPLNEAEPALESASIPDQPADDDQVLTRDLWQSEPDTSGHELVDTPTDTPTGRPTVATTTATTQLPPDETPSAVTQFPPNDSFEASLQDLDSSTASTEAVDPLAELDALLDEDIPLENVSENVSENASLAGRGIPEQTVPDVPPSDFDDDLDFFPSQGDQTSAKDALEKGGVESQSLTEPTSGGGAAGLASALGVGAVAAGAVSTAPPATAAPSEPTSEPTPLEASPAAMNDTPQLDVPDDDGDDDPTGGEPADWFLGIDLGATGVSAVLINQRGNQVYPLCWNMAGDSEPNRFRLPAVVQIDAASDNPQLGIVGPAALQQSQPLLRNLKLMVKAGIPNGGSGEPWMQWADHVPLPLGQLQAAIVQLLSTFHSDRMSCRAVGLTAGALRRALEDLKGVVVGYPTNWPDTYAFNLRECVLSAGLVSSPDQVFFVEEAIAALLSALPAPNAVKDIPENQQPGLYNCNWSGGTVVISAGSILTETAVANLPSELDQLSYQNFSMRGYTYAGDGIDQDIICQLLHLPLPAVKSGENSAPADSIGRWESLGLSEITLPQPGEADRVTRHRLRQRLNDSPLGREAILAARELKMALQEEDEVEVELGDHAWVITRKDLETKVFLPYIQRINRQVNALLSKQNLATQGVKQVVCTGGSASLGVIARWLRQKFPNATIIQDTYAGEYSNSCSRVAYGLANLCHYPKVLDANRHQYNDYFLLLELLRILPEQPLPAGGILHLLEQRGINTQACQAHVLALIEGHLPPGLVPTAGDRPLISAQSSDIATYKSLSELPLFRKQGGQIYIADTQQGERLRSHLENLLSTKAQSLTEPMTAAALTAPVTH